VEIAALALSLAISTLLSASESALVCADPLDLENLASRNDPRAVRALALLRERRRLLLAILIIRSVMAVLATALGTLVVVHWLGVEVGVAVGGAALSAALVLCCEVAPKAYASSRAVALTIRLRASSVCCSRSSGRSLRSSSASPAPAGAEDPWRLLAGGGEGNDAALGFRWPAPGGGIAPHRCGLKLSEIPVRAIMTPLADCRRCRPIPRLPGSGDLHPRGTQPPARLPRPDR